MGSTLFVPVILHHSASMPHRTDGLHALCDSGFSFITSTENDLRRIPMIFSRSSRAFCSDAAFRSRKICRDVLSIVSMASRRLLRFASGTMDTIRSTTRRRNAGDPHLRTYEAPTSHSAVLPISGLKHVNDANRLLVETMPHLHEILDRSQHRVDRVAGRNKVEFMTKSTLCQEFQRKARDPVQHINLACTILDHICHRVSKLTAA